MPLIIIADTPQEVLGKVADWLVEYAETVMRNDDGNHHVKAVRSDTMQLIAMVLRAGTVMPAASFNPDTSLYVEAPRATPRWNRRVAVKVKP
jgi:hypothetical protein